MANKPVGEPYVESIKEEAETDVVEEEQSLKVEDMSAGVSAVDEAEVGDSPEPEVEAEPATEETTTVDDAPAADGELTEVEQTTAEELVEESPTEVNMAETTVDLETEAIKQENTTEEETTETTEELNAASGIPETTTRETQTTTTVYEATETSILSVGTLEGEALKKNEVDTPKTAAEAELADQAPEKTDKPTTVALPTSQLTKQAKPTT
ncbi:Putative plasma membrane protein [Phytophthora palmivora]|uniref:Plasma membrane protein n=1 Tax=Phytophthora palmivora TaxID=4796 RepID=A0A2P4YD20_9STRA|nr:Putative plasma membrane protein [Phytophthora palmivora]